MYQQKLIILTRLNLSFLNFDTCTKRCCRIISTTLLLLLEKHRVYVVNIKSSGDLAFSQNFNFTVSNSIQNQSCITFKVYNLSRYSLRV